MSAGSGTLGAIKMDTACLTDSRLIELHTQSRTGRFLVVFASAILATTRPAVILRICSPEPISTIYGTETKRGGRRRETVLAGGDTQKNTHVETITHLEKTPHCVPVETETDRAFISRGCLVALGTLMRSSLKNKYWRCAN